MPWVVGDHRPRARDVLESAAGLSARRRRATCPSDPSLPLLPGDGQRDHLQQDGAVAEHARAAARMADVCSASWPRYFERWQFKHPKPDDFFRIANEVSGQDLGWFFDQVYRSSNVVRLRDRGVDSSTEDDARFRTELSSCAATARRCFRWMCCVTFENGEQVTEQWDGRDRWKTLHLRHGRRAPSAQVDPDRVLLLDVNYTNNSKTLDAAGRPRRRRSGR